MKYVIALLAVLFLVLQFQLWLSGDGFPAVWRLEGAVEQQRAENEQLRERNEALRAEVEDLKTGVGAVEERARSELGMIGRDETFYQVVDEDKGRDVEIRDTK